MDTPDVITYNPEDIDRNTVIWNVMSYMDPGSTKEMISKVSELSIYTHYEGDNLLWKRRVENTFNNGDKIGSDDIVSGGYRVKWETVYNALEKKYRKIGQVDWNKLFYVEDDDPEYVELALDMRANLDDKMGKVFRSALQQNKVNMVKRLLSEPTFDPNQKIPIKIKSRDVVRMVNQYPWLFNGTASTIKEFMKDSRFDPTLSGYNIIRHLARGGSLYQQYKPLKRTYKEKTGTKLPPKIKASYKFKLRNESVKIANVILELLNDSRIIINIDFAQAVVDSAVWRRRLILLAFLRDIRVRYFLMSDDFIPRSALRQRSLEDIRDIIKTRYGSW